MYGCTTLKIWQSELFIVLYIYTFALTMCVFVCWILEGGFLLSRFAIVYRSCVALPLRQSLLCSLCCIAFCRRNERRGGEHGNSSRISICENVCLASWFGRYNTKHVRFLCAQCVCVCT